MTGEEKDRKGDSRVIPVPEIGAMIQANQLVLWSVLP